MSKTWQFAVIGGTGMGELFSKFEGFVPRHAVVDVPTVGLRRVHYAEVITASQEFIFIDRHRAVGPDMEGDFLLPHQLDHRLYMGLLAHFGVRYVLAMSAVGGISARRPNVVGAIVRPTDFIDFTHGVYTFARQNCNDPTTFHRSSEGLLCSLGRDADEEPLILGVGTRGPRFETQAESSLYSRVGVDLLGMQTAVPEAVLAREASMHYALRCVVTNLPLMASTSGHSVAEVMVRAQPGLQAWIFRTMRRISLNGSGAWKCPCSNAPPVFDVVKDLQFNYTTPDL